jgi:hypothetical protein
MTERQEKYKEKRKYLQELSKLAKMRMGMDCEGMTVNEILIEEIYTDDLNYDFNTLHNWSKKGYKVKKGSISFAVWGKPKASQELEKKGVEASPDDEIDNFYPLCYLFSNAQVEKRKLSE